MKKYYHTKLSLFFTMLRIILSERTFRLVTSALALLEGMGPAVAKIHEASGLGKSTIYRGAHEVVEIYEAIERGDGEKYWEALSVPRPNNPFDEIYITHSTISTDAASMTTCEKDTDQPGEQSTVTDPPSDLPALEDDGDSSEQSTATDPSSDSPALEDVDESIEQSTASNSSTKTEDSPALKGICRKPRKRGRKNQGKTKQRRKARDRRNLKGTVGRPPVYTTYPEIIRLVLQIICCYVYGDPMTTQLWVSASQHHIREMLSRFNVVVSDPTIGKLLWALGYSRQKNKKMLPVVNQHPDRDKEFERIKVFREYAAKRDDWGMYLVMQCLSLRDL